MPGSLSLSLSLARVRLAALVSQSVSVWASLPPLSSRSAAAAAAASQPFQPDLAQIPYQPSRGPQPDTLLCFPAVTPRLTSPALALGNSNHLVKETPRDQHPPTLDPLPSFLSKVTSRSRKRIFKNGASPISMETTRRRRRRRRRRSIVTGGSVFDADLVTCASLFSPSCSFGRLLNATLVDTILVDG